MRVLLSIAVAAALSLQVSAARQCSKTEQGAAVDSLLKTMGELKTSVDKLKLNLKQAQTDIEKVKKDNPQKSETLRCADMPSSPIMRTCFDITGFKGSTWKASNGGASATITGARGADLAKDSINTYGLSGALKYVEGSTQTKFSTTGSILPAKGQKYTVCSVTRYTGSNTNRILNGGGGVNWLHGHWGSRAGISHYNGWQGQHNGRVTTKQNWLYYCTTNSNKNTVLANGNSYYNSNGGSSAYTPSSVHINSGGCCSGEVSEWGMAQLITYDGWLTESQMSSVQQQQMGFGGGKVRTDLITCTNMAKIKLASGKLRSCFSLDNYWNNKIKSVGGTVSVNAKLTGTVSLKEAPGHPGENTRMKYIYGSTGSRFYSQEDSGRNANTRVLGSSYTVCSVTKYTGTTQRRILNGGSGNWLHGHWATRAGIAHYNQWQGQHNGRVDNKLWVFQCSYNSGSNNKIMYVNGKKYTGVTGGTSAVPTYIGINVGGCCGGETSQWGFANLATYDGHLGESDMYKIHKYQMTMLFTNDLSQPPPPPPPPGPGPRCMTKCKDVPVKGSLKSCFSMDNYADGGAWKSTVGNYVGKKMAGDVTVRKQFKGQDGATNEFTTFLAGNYNAKYTFGNVLQSANAYTVCSVSRYMGGPRYGRILNGGSANWLHGHWASRAGIAHYGSWKGQHNGRVTPKTDWVTMCATNLAGRHTVYVNAIEQVVSGGGSNPVSISINYGRHGNENTDWAVAFLATYSKRLSTTEMRSMMKWLRREK